jgi:hypothetical protein
MLLSSLAHRRLTFSTYHRIEYYSDTDESEDDSSISPSEVSSSSEDSEQSFKRTKPKKPDLEPSARTMTLLLPSATSPRHHPIRSRPSPNFLL